MSSSKIESYQQPWESNEHWALRRDFISTYYDKFPEVRLLCLAQVYANIKLLNCSYPETIMKQVQELAKGVKSNTIFQSKINFFQEISQPKKRPAEEKMSDSEIPDKMQKTLKSTVDNISRTMQCQIDKDLQKFKRLSDEINSLKSKNIPDLLRVASNTQHLTIEYATNSARDPCHNPIFTCKLYIDKILITETESSSKKAARKKTTKKALQLLRTSNFVIVSKNGTLQLQESEDKQSLKNESRNNFDASLNKFDTSQVNRQINEASSLSNCVLEHVDVNLDSLLKKPDSAVFVILDYRDIRKKNVSDAAILRRSAAINHQNIIFDNCLVPCKNGTGTWNQCRILFGNEEISCEFGKSKQQARDSAAEKALEKLKEKCYTIKVKSISTLSAVTKRTFEAITPSSILSSDNKGFKMMQAMGYKGGGIGKNSSSSIQEPIGISDGMNRGEGLGFSKNVKSFNEKIETLINNYMKGWPLSELVFSNEFSNEEKKKIHKIATKYNLKHHSTGVGGHQFIILSRKLTPKELLKHLAEAGGSTDKYELIQPRTAQFK